MKCNDRESVGSGKSKGRGLSYFIILPLIIFYAELVLKIYCFHALFDRGLLYTALFSIVFGVALAILSSLWKGNAKRTVATVLVIVVTLFFMLQAVYVTVFNTFFTLFSVVGAEHVLGQFWLQALEGIYRSGIPLLFLLAPVVLFIVFGRRFAPVRRPKVQYLMAFIALAAGVQLLAVTVIKGDQNGVITYDYVYSGTFSPLLAVPRFGILTTLRLDVQNMLRENIAANVSKNDDDIANSTDETAATNGGGDEIGQPNVLEIDFDKLIANESDPNILDMDKYFASVVPTDQNQYSGMFQGYNLIWIVAESFSSLALDQAHTPTLYALAHEGFVFNNFYNPLWGVSTSDGEYVTATGLLPEAGVWSYYKSGSNEMPFGFGNMFNALGYTSRAYHDNTYTFYDRNISYPNMGYTYKGVGNGLNITDQWPESDVEMMQASVPDYIRDDHFLTYYMTVSGHMNYDFSDNRMAIKHEAAVADLPYSEPARAYVACNMELDEAVQSLISQLSAAGKLDNTVIVLSGDHYPYGLDQQSLEELAGHPIEKNFEMYRSTLIVWNAQMAPVQVDKYCSSLDIMPTLANLFGLPYDSRLVMGRDILSTAPSLVIFNNRSFITDLGRYNSATDQFIPNEGVTVPDGYVQSIAQEMENKFKYSAEILDYNYYKIVLPPVGGS